MPELPEVERTVKLLSENCIGTRVKAINTREQGGGPREGLLDDKFFTDDKIVDLIAANVIGSIVKSVQRKGKYFWMEFQPFKNEDQDKKCDIVYFIMHFGMTGSIAVNGVKRFKFSDFKVDEKWPPKYTKMEIVFERLDENKKPILISFTDPRRLGRLYYSTGSPLRHHKIVLLGPDPINDGLNTKVVTETLSKLKSPIKSVLLDQGRICCGIGNYLADEVLYNACIHPKAACNRLSHEQVERLVSSIIEICTEAVIRNGDNFPEDWIFHHRWKKMKRTYLGDSQPEKIKKLRVSFIKVGGRTTCLVATRQKMGMKDSKE